MTPKHMAGMSLYDVIRYGVCRDFKNEQIIQIAVANGFAGAVDDNLVNALRRDFNAQMIDFFRRERQGIGTSSIRVTQ